MRAARHVPGKILLVDDSALMLLMGRQLLQYGGYQVVTARSGEDALRTAAVELPDLILLDVMLPSIDGIEVCRQLRAKRESRDVPIIMVTTRSTAAAARAAFDSGCTDYVTKPYDRDTLIEKVRSHLR